MRLEEASTYRMSVARLNHFSSDRPDIQHPAKEARKNMAQPQFHHWSLLKRIGTYLVDAPRVVQTFRWQSEMNTVTGHSDSDWAGDQKIRKSTSEGVCGIGPHVTKPRSSTQQMVALSSAEFEPYALLKRVCQTFGLMNFANDLWIKLQAIAHIDVSAAFAASQRQGFGKLMHIDTHWLRIQERINWGDIKANNAHGKGNPTDLMIKHLFGQEIVRHFGDMNFEIASGRVGKSFAPNVVIFEKKDSLDQ